MSLIDSQTISVEVVIFPRQKGALIDAKCVMNTVKLVLIQRRGIHSNNQTSHKNCYNFETHSIHFFRCGYSAMTKPKA